MKWRQKPMQRGRGVTERTWTGCPEHGITLTVRYDQHARCWFGKADGKLMTRWQRLSGFRAGDAMAEWEKATADLVRVMRKEMAKALGPQ